MEREPGPELMDGPDVDPAELARSLRDLRELNRLLGWRRFAVREALRLAAAVPHRPVRVIDVATGSADVPLALARAARRHGIAIRATATDLHPGALAEARRLTAADPDVEVAPADALSLPFPDASFDVALCCTALHHFSGEEAVRVLREMARVASRGVVVTDLRRTPWALAGVRLLAATRWRRHPVTRHDGERSVRAAFTAAELRALARAAGLRASVRRLPFFRLGLVHEGGR